MKKKTVFFLLLAAVLLSSCSEAAKPAETQTNEPVQTEAAVTEEETKPDSYAALRELDYNGNEVTMLVRSEFAYEFCADTETGDVVNDTVLKRNRAAEELLNIRFRTEQVTGSFSTQGTFKSAYKNSILAQDNAYQLVASAANYMLGLSAEGLFANLRETENVSIAMPWYSQGYIENLSMGNKLYLVAGSASINLLENMCVLFFNKELLTSLDYAAPYDDVRNGTWSFDKLKDMVKDSYADLNGSGTVDDGDRFGYLTYNNMINAQLFGMGQRYIDKDKDGVLYFKTELSEHDIAVYEAVERFMNELDATYHYNDTANNALVATENLLTIWNTGNILFMPQVLSTAAKMRDTVFDFGILPMPKFDAAQQDYSTFILENVTVMGLSPVGDTAMAGAVLETLSIAGYEELSPVYFDIAMKDKYSRDTDTKDMLDIIRGSVSFEYPLMTQFMAQCIQGGKPIVSAFEKEKKAAGKTFSKIVEGWMEQD